MQTGSREKRKRKLPFFLPFGGCKGRCVYCNQQTITGVTAIPQPESVAAALSQINEPVEVCYFGGSFCRLGYGRIKAYLDAVLSNGQENTVRFSTYPGDLMDDRIRELVLSYPVSRVELGVPSMDPAVLAACRRDADPELIIENIELLKREKVPLALQLMIGLPGQTEESSVADLELFARLKGGLSWEMRLYPCLVIKNTELENMMNSGAYRPLSLSEAVSWGGHFLRVATSLGFVIIRAGLQESQLLAEEVAGGPHHPALGELMMADAMAGTLAEACPDGPWIVDRRDMSKFTGHGMLGIKKLAQFTGKRIEEVKNLLEFA